MNHYDLVFFCIENNVDNVRRYYRYYRKFINPRKIIVIGPFKIKKIVDAWSIKEIVFIDEDCIFEHMNYESVKDLIIKRTTDKKAYNRVGWYFQQFLKMAYATICEETDYLVWDADTVPLKKLHTMIGDGRRVFHVKREYNKVYFDTMNRLFRGLKRCEKYSFISEHMLIKKEIMNEIIDAIQNNQAIKGDSFWEKILYAVDKEELCGSGFSEFETYGTYVINRKPKEYVAVKWKSLREGTVFFGNSISERQGHMLSEKYDAISFEKHEAHMRISKLFNHVWARNLIVISLFEGVKELIKRISKKLA
ncbi:MAG: DUF6492 family protein [Lachnospiraceae bacterium]|nr:DUF6492 family protein [Lachnospiraceae bacterium]